MGIAPPTTLLIELVAAALGVRLHVDDGVAVLAAAAGLAHELAADALDGVSDRLAVGDLRPADVGVDLELAHQPVDDDLQVQLAHAGDDRLAGLLVGAHAEGRILLGQPAEGGLELVLIGLRLRLDRHVDHGIGEVDRLEQHRRVRVAQRVAGGRLLEADGGGDGAGGDLLDVLAVVGVHLQQPADPLLAAGRGVEDVGARVELAGVDAEVGQLADERVGHDLEGERREGGVQARLALGRLARLGIGAGHRRHVDRARQVVDDRVQQRLHALVLEGGAEQHRRDRVVERGGTDGGLQLVLLDRLLLEEGVQDVVVVVGDGLDQLVAVVLGLLLELVRHLALLPLLPQRVDVGDRLHRDQVDVADELVLGSDRDLQGDRLRAQPVDHRLDGVEEVGARAVHLVDERDPGHARTCRPAARPSPTAAGRRPPSRTGRPRRPARAASARPRP